MVFDVKNQERSRTKNGRKAKETFQISKEKSFSQSFFLQREQKKSSGTCFSIWQLHQEAKLTFYSLRKLDQGRSLWVAAEKPLLSEGKKDEKAKYPD